MTDAELLEQHRQGSPTAFAELVRHRETEAAKMRSSNTTTEPGAWQELAPQFEQIVLETA